MLKFDNTHIFTGYLKQLLASFNLPTCKVYTKEFAEYYEQHGKEDPRVIESFDSIKYVYGSETSASKTRIASSTNYLKGNEIYNYFWAYDQNRPNLNHSNTFWKRVSDVAYYGSTSISGLTRTLNSYGSTYDTVTHEYLGDYLRFMRDYYKVDLMPLYNCFNNKICSNIYYKHKLNTIDDTTIYPDDPAKYLTSASYRVFDSKDPKYRIYAIPVKLFSNYTIAIDCDHTVEMFCGFYKTSLDLSNKSVDLINKTYKKFNGTFFNQPLLYDKLDVSYWNFDSDSKVNEATKLPQFINNSIVTRWDIINREQDLKLFIKIPAACRSSIVILEGDYRNFNNFIYYPVCYNMDGSIFNAETNDISKTKLLWKYEQNRSVLNFENKVDFDNYPFNPIGKLQLLAFNTGESYPFSDRLIEYLCGSVITPVDEITDNIKRAQRVMAQNQHYFKIDGLWEDKMQKIAYDYIMNSGPIEPVKAANGTVSLVDTRRGRHPKLGYTSKSNMYDVLGYIDKDVEKLYASWVKVDNEAKIRDTIQNVDIYNGLYDL